MLVEPLDGDIWVGGLGRKSLCHNPSVYVLKCYKGETGRGSGEGLLEGASWKDTSEQKMPRLTRDTQGGPCRAGMCAKPGEDQRTDA